jgi:putative serine protease PepD
LTSSEEGQDGPGHGDRYYGPFGPPENQSAYTPRGPSFDPIPPAWTTPPSAGPSPVPGTGPAGPARRAPWGASVIALAALTALVVGGTAGYGGARLAERSAVVAPAPVTVSAPVPATAFPAPQQSSVTASPLPPAPAQANTVEVAKRVVPATVMIQVGNGTGSGFVLDTSGRIMTNNHVVAGAADGTKIRIVLANGKRRTASLLGRSPSYDLAVVKVDPSGLTPLPVGRSSSVQVGQPVIAVGAPLGLPGTVTQGIVSAKDRPVVVNASAAADAPTAYINAIQTDTPINPGNSGGPLVDAAGRVIGINSAILTLGQSAGQTGNIGLGFAIPIDQALSIGQQLIARGKARYPVIGATVADGSGSGVALETVESGGPASDAGLRPGDVITKIDDHPVTTMEELIVTIRTHQPKDVVTLAYTRGSSSRSARVTLGSKEG